MQKILWIVDICNFFLFNSFVTFELSKLSNKRLRYSV